MNGNSLSATPTAPVPVAAASIGQVHRAIAFDPDTGEERPVAVKVQYPGVDQAIEAEAQVLADSSEEEGPYHLSPPLPEFSSW